METERRRFLAAAVLIAIVGVALRLTGIGWGLPAQVSPYEPPIHPDEHVAVAGAAMLYHGPSGLQFLWGGSLYPRTAWLANAAIQSVDPQPPVYRVGPGVRRWENGSSLLVVLRVLNVVLALATAGFVGFVGVVLAGPVVGLVAASLLLFFPGHVLDSHYARPDVLTACFLAAALACAVHAARTEGRAWFAIGGACAGLACATMLSGAIGFGALAGAALEGGRFDAAGRRRALHRLAAVALGASAGWLAGNAEALVYWRPFLQGIIHAASSHQGGAYAFPVRLLTVVAFYAFGSVAAIAAWLGMVVLARRRPIGFAAVLGHLVLGTLLLGRVGGDMMRHLEPLAPAAAVAAAVGLGAVVRGLSKRGLGVVPAGVVVYGGALAFTLQLSVVYVGTMQFAEDPRYRAGRWLTQNLAPGTRIGRTASFDGDVAYSPRPPEPHELDVQTLRLYGSRSDPPVEPDGFDVIATSDYAESHARRSQARQFFETLDAGGDFERTQPFAAGRDPFCLPDLWGAKRPSDLLYVRTAIQIFERRPSTPPRAGRGSSPSS